jgi:hypothetical protein
MPNMAAKLLLAHRILPISARPGNPLGGIAGIAFM